MPFVKIQDMEDSLSKGALPTDYHIMTNWPMRGGVAKFESCEHETEKRGQIKDISII